MMLKKRAKRKRSILKGGLAGLAGGIAGAAAKALAGQVFAPRVAGHAVPEQGASGAIPWAFGAVAGAVYGAAVELEPKAGAWRGAAFGLALNKLELMTGKGTPRTGLTEPTVRERTQERQSEWVTHAVYGVVTDTVRRMVRSGLC